MKYKHLAVALLFIFVQGCANTSGSSANLENIVIAEPMTVNYKSEIALARLTEVIHRAEISDVQKAQLYYDRGVIYDSVGLRSLARLDFNRALRLKPDLIEAYNFIGIHFTQLQEFNQAYEQFDSAIELSPEHEYAFLNRGIALYYGGRPQLAADDFSTFLSKQENDPYRLLWLYLAEKEVDGDSAKTNLKARSLKVQSNVWAKQVIALYLDELSLDQFVTNLTQGIGSNKDLTDRLCEAYFYLGKFYQANGDNRVAANYFKLALSTNVYEFVEHRYAKLELDLMRDSLSTNAR
ncbi:lipoprotein NlpI [Thalassotalea atypica]|uniref:lipoprotein NlpI n=1 Tax=Thalassotalea atypica TaxID=2054316 RepID=UPI002572B086|nr:lipoprotein NlpI [Thalassotalea atypica]